MGKKCCVPGCGSAGKELSHKFPKDPERCSKWIDSLKLDDFKKYTMMQMQNYVVCHKHFDKKDYSSCLNTWYLLRHAVPILSHIHNEIDIVSNTVIQDIRYIAIQDILQEQQQEQQQQQHSQNIEPAQDVIIQDYGCSSQTSETRMGTNSRRPQLQEITRCKNLDSTARRLYNINMKLQHQNKYLKRKHRRESQKRKGPMSITSSTADAMSTGDIQNNFLEMIIRNSNVAPQVCNYTVQQISTFFLNGEFPKKIKRSYAPEHIPL